MDRTQKSAAVAELHDVFEASGLVVIVHQTGLTVEESTNLRRKMRSANANFKVTKNRLARIALKGTRFEALDGLFTGPTAIAFSKDPVAAAKVAVDFAKANEKLTIVGGSLGSQTLDVAAVKALASLPSLDELRGKLVGLLQAPATRVAGVLQAPAGQLARVFGAYAKTGEAA